MQQAHMSKNKKPKIAVYAISKNEEKFAERCVASAAEADLFVLADTGSTDSTVKKSRKAAKGFGLDISVHDICVTPWRFDKARDTALCLIPSDIDVCVSIDLDEILQDGWRQEIERLWKPGTTRMRYMFQWSEHKKFYASKIHSRHGYHWHHPCHEYIRSDGRITESVVSTDKLLIVHDQDRDKSRSQYLDLLELSVKEDPHCPRNAFYYGRELHYVGRKADCIRQLKKFLDMPEATWNVERAYAMRLIGINTDDKSARSSMFHAAIAEDPGSMDSHLMLAEDAFRAARWSQCLSSAESACECEFRGVYADDMSRKWRAHDLAAIACYRLGLQRTALHHGSKAVSLSPLDDRLIKNLKMYEEKARAE